MAAADVYDFSSPSLFASGPAALPNPRQAKRPTVSLDAMVRKGRVGGFHDSELKEQLAAQVFSFSQEASNAMHHPLHGFTGGSRDIGRSRHSDSGAHYEKLL